MPTAREAIFDGDEVKPEHITSLIRLIETQTDEWHWAHFGWFETDCFRPYKTRPSALVIHRLFFSKPPRG